MKAARLALAVTTAATLAAGALIGGVANAATGDKWTGFQVVDTVPAATTQTDVLGMLPQYKQGGEEIYLWNIVRMVENKQTGEKSWVYCVELRVQGGADEYTEDPTKGTALGQANAGKINRVLAESNLPDPGELEVTPADGNWVDASVHLLAAKKADHIEMTAVQLALWHYTDGLNFNASNTIEVRDYYPNSYVGDADTADIADVLARYDELVAAAEASPLANPSPAITITPADSSADAGEAVVLTVEGQDIVGTIALDADQDLYAADGEVCDTDTVLTSLPAVGGKVCAVSSGAGSLEVTATGSSARHTSHVLYAPRVQTLIGIAPEQAEATATIEWTAVETTATPSPSETPSTTPTPEVSETSTGGGAEVEETEVADNAAAPSGALANTGAFGLIERVAIGLAALALGLGFVLLTRRRGQYS